MGIGHRENTYGKNSVFTPFTQKKKKRKKNLKNLNHLLGRCLCVVIIFVFYLFFHYRNVIHTLVSRTGNEWATTRPHGATGTTTTTGIGPRKRTCVARVRVSGASPPSVFPVVSGATAASRTRGINRDDHVLVYDTRRR